MSGLPCDRPDADPVADARRALEAAVAAPYRPNPPTCRHCTLVADSPGGPVFACVADTPGCPLDAALGADW